VIGDPCFIALVFCIAIHSQYGELQRRAPAEFFSGKCNYFSVADVVLLMTISSGEYALTSPPIGATNAWRARRVSRMS
ncbi:hypothetical protein, partial [Klebsiella pneumoniae]|uniref:hypothetical protein n=1 Tax=Klebsiella pneumoniae TaxID=573 RepID=UPI00272F8C80